MNIQIDYSKTAEARINVGILARIYVLVYRRLQRYPQLNFIVYNCYKRKHSNVRLEFRDETSELLQSEVRSRSFCNLFITSRWIDSLVYIVMRIYKIPWTSFFPSVLCVPWVTENYKNDVNKNFIVKNDIRFRKKLNVSFEVKRKLRANISKANEKWTCCEVKSW